MCTLTLKVETAEMPQNQRLRVWRGDLKKTSGGLTKAMLMKNKRGKIVSKKKSEAAKKNKDKNNLGAWLRSKGDKFLSKGLSEENIKRKGKPGRKAFKKEVPKKVEPKKAEPPKSGTKPKAPPKITKSEPMKAGEKKDYSKISVGNILAPGGAQSAKEKRDFWIRKARIYKKKLKKDQKWIENKLGPMPAGVSWNKI